MAIDSSEAERQNGALSMYQLYCDLGHPITKRKQGLRIWEFEKMFGLVEQTCQVCKRQLAAEDVRWQCNDACNFDVCESCYLVKVAGTAPACEPFQPVDMEAQAVVLEINAQQTKAAAVFESALPLLRKRKEELETMFKHKDCSEDTGGPDALAFSQLFRLRGISGVSPIEKYQAILDELKDPRMPEIDAAFVQHAAGHGLEEVREKLKRLSEVAHECQNCVHETGAAATTVQEKAIVESNAAIELLETAAVAALARVTRDSSVVSDTSRRFTVLSEPAQVSSAREVGNPAAHSERYSTASAERLTPRQDGD
jgi:hypothetical protein